MIYRAAASDGPVWITGASSGIGRAVAIELARRGYQVAVTARRAEALATLVEETAALGGKMAAFPGDVTDADAVAAVVADIEGSLGPIALAFLNAGAAFSDPPETFGGEGFRRTFELNVAGSAHCLGPLLRAMRPRRRGQIAINASLAGYRGLPQGIAYGASKAALIYIAEGLQLAEAANGIRVQVVNPGFVRTPLTDRNGHAMPFIVPLDQAARRICEGLAHGGFEITFPRRLAWPMRAMRMLPHPIYAWLVRRLVGA
jgi:NAD(P)-dependent dehydrogenase (short-subunit alcohol dehydrogenase family)